MTRISRRSIGVGEAISTPLVSALRLLSAGVSRPAGLRETSLLPLITGTTNAGPGYVYAECHTEGNCTGSFLIRKGDWKYIYFSYYPNNLLFNLRDDPGELSNLACMPRTEAIEKEMHAALTSVADPDSVTARAFEKQDQTLLRLVKDNKPGDFYQILVGRLGEGQAAVLTHKHYPDWKPANLIPRSQRNAAE